MTARILKAVYTVTVPQDTVVPEHNQAIRRGVFESSSIYFYQPLRDFIEDQAQGFVWWKRNPLAMVPGIGYRYTISFMFELECDAIAFKLMF